MAISALQGTCAAAEYVLEGQTHLPLYYENFCTFYSVAVQCVDLRKVRRVAVVIKDCLEILTRLTDARLE